MLKLLEEIENRVIYEGNEDYSSLVIQVATGYMKKGGKTPFDAATKAKQTFSHGVEKYDVNIDELEQILYGDMLKYLIKLNLGKRSGPDLAKYFPVTLEYFNQPTKSAVQFAEYIMGKLGGSVFGVGVSAEDIASTYSKKKSWRKDKTLFPMKGKM